MSIKAKFLAFTSIVALISLLMTAASPAQASVSFQVSPKDTSTPTRVDPGLDIIEIRATETSTSLDDNWELEIVTNALTLYWTKDWSYGFFLDTNSDNQYDHEIVSFINPTTNHLSRAALIRTIDKVELCNFPLVSNPLVVNVNGWTVRESALFRVPKTCLPKSQNIGIAAYAINNSSGIIDTLPESGWVQFKQPWVQAPATSVPTIQPTPQESLSPLPTQVKALVSAFPKDVKTLSVKQKTEIKAIVKKYPNVVSVGCSTYVKGGSSLHSRVKAKAQAKLICSYFKELNSRIEILNFASSVELSTTSVLGKTRIYLNLNNSGQ